MSDPLEPLEPLPPWTDAPSDPGVPFSLPSGSVAAGPPPVAGPGPETDGKRAAWVAWASTAAAIVLVLGGFFGAKALTHTSSPSVATAGAATAGGTGATGTANGDGDGPRGRPGTSGTITAVNGSTLTVKPTTSTAGAAVKVTTSSSTRVTVAQTVTLSSIANGDRVFVTGTTSGTTVTATRITDMGAAAVAAPNGGTGGPLDREGGAGGANAPPGGPEGGAGGNRPGGFTGGTVTSVTADAMVISANDGTTTTVTTTSGTTVTKTVAGTLAALKVGDTVRVVGTTATDGSVAATSISEGAGGGIGGFGGFAPGDAPNGNGA